MLDTIQIGILITIVVIIIIVACNIIYSNYYTISPEVNWNAEEILDKDGNSLYLPKDALLYEFRYRGLPTKLDRSYGGSAIWNEQELRKKEYPYSKICIYDKLHPVDSPYEHIPFLEYYLTIPIVSYNILKLLSFSKLFAFSEPTNELIVRSDSSVLNQHMLAIAVKYIKNQISIDDVKIEIEKIENTVNNIKINTSRGFSKERELYF